MTRATELPGWRARDRVKVADSLFVFLQGAAGDPPAAKRVGFVRVQLQDGVEVKDRPLVFSLHQPGDSLGVAGRVGQRFQPYRGVKVADGLEELAQFPVGHAPVVKEDVVSGVEGDGLIEILQRPGAGSPSRRRCTPGCSMESRRPAPA